MKKAKSIMLQGTASTVGKSILCTALCRIFTEDNYDVFPFKAQNMSLNSGVTPDGHEMGRAQIMQAEACYKVPSSKMNPILLKPTSDRKSQVVLLGEVWNNLDAVDYFKKKKELKEKIQDVYGDISSRHEVIVIEGAGSPAEINLSDEFVNMGMAKIAESPVLLVGDIDKGGVFASLYGTIMLLPEEERKLIKGIIINKFRGSIELLEPGLKQIEDLTGVPVVGVIPHFKLDLEDEDSVTDFSKFNRDGELKIAVIKVPYMSNFTDFNSLALNTGVRVEFVELNQEIEKYHLIILPGSKSTIGDLKALKESGMDDKIIKERERGKFIFGICGGYQMLGKEVSDVSGVESNLSRETGLGLLPIYTEFQKDKNTVLSEGYENLSGNKVKGYEIHMGKTYLTETSDIKDFIKLTSTDGEDGVISQDEKVIGTYFHGIFDNGEFTLQLLNKIRKTFNIELQNKVFNYYDYKNTQYDELALIVRKSLDMEKIYKILNEGV
ncbi:cobyric acid synthase [Clostridium sp. 'White wine YQ']|uniref:cobyric acid synthase n=1 Tax=Clostridium sp. 'White wine YQ' TaxID=3027474 RepID=UPI002365B4B4|nr:cobyric acid synthase [Clostridium sp. 'White wine YQ']MDD7794987.1 cobyric acid synthase [Clostridium sp. 'White wine YQ']